MDYKDYNDYELLNYIAEGNEDANNIVIEKYQPLIKSLSTKMISKCQNNGLEISDLEQEGMIGLMHAIETFSEQKDTTFYTYARTCIERKMISALVSSQRLKHRILNESISYDNEEVTTKVLKDDQTNPENIIINIDIEEQIVNSVKQKLTDFEDQVFQLMIAGFDYKEIADILDKDKKSIDNAMQRIKIKVREIMKTNNS